MKTFDIDWERLKQEQEAGAPNSPFKDALEHEICGLMVLLNIWHDETPEPLRRGLLRRLSILQGWVQKAQISKSCILCLKKHGANR